MSQSAGLPYSFKLHSLTGQLLGFMVANDEATEQGGVCIFVQVEPPFPDEFGQLLASLANPPQEFDWKKIDADVVIFNNQDAEFLRITPALSVNSPDKRTLGRVELF